MARPAAPLVPGPALDNGSRSLVGVRIGVLRGFGVLDWPAELEAAIAALAKLGADIVDPVAIAIDDGW